MAQFRQASLIALALPLAGCSPAASEPAAPQSGAALQLVLPAEAGRLRIVNGGTAPVPIERTIGVERRTGDGWLPIPTEFNAIAACVKRPINTPVVIPAGATLDVQRWQGFSCSGQCQGTCRRNIYAGAGPFHVVVTTLPDQGRIISSPFTMPARPAPVSAGRPFRL